MPVTLPSLPTLQPNPAWAKLPLFNRKNWTRVRFDDVVANLNETCDPAEAGLERVIAMEHLEPGSLHIRAWGNVADGTTFTRRCRPGQVLFGKRRAYQRKVAVAEFDAVVSGDIYVLAPKGERLLPELLPFLCLSERFFQHAVGTSAGSLSPRTNWSSLASFEFDLPPLDQQRRIAEILWAVDKVKRALLQAETDATALKLRLADEQFDQLRSEALSHKKKTDLVNNVSIIKVADLLADGKSLTYGILQPGPDVPDGIPMLRAIDIEDGELSGTQILRVAKKIEADYERTRLRGREVLLSVMGTIGRTIMVRNEWIGWNVNRALAVIRLGEQILPEFFYHWLRSPQMQTQLTKDSIGTAQLRINLSHFREYSLPVPPTERQAEVVARIEKALAAQKAVTKHREENDVLMQGLINSLLGERS